MPRPIWSGAISFGLVSVPVQLVAATEDRSVRFRQVHLADMGQVRNKKICEIEDREVAWGEIGHGYELPGDGMVSITDEELENIPLPTAKAIEILTFVAREEVDLIRASASYYVAANGPVAAKPYVLLRKALERSDKVAIAKFAWHGRERLAMLRVVGEGALALQTLKWPDEVRDPSSLAPADSDIDEDELEGALALTDTMTTDGMPGLQDEYRHALEEVIAAKSEGRRPEAPERVEEPAGQIVDLMAALNASVKQARERRGEEPASVHEMSKPKKKTAVKKTTSRRRTA